MRTSGHKLTPPEAWFSDWMLRRQQAHRTAPLLRLEQDYGPEGIALGAAAILLGLTGAVVGWVGLILLLASGGRGPMLHPAYYVIVAGILIELPAIIRSVQGIYAGRRFRGDRPFVK